MTIKNCDMPANPVLNVNGGTHWCGNVPISSEYCTGLTKREQFAAMAMQGMLSNPAIVDSTLSSSYPLIVSKAIIQADVLLEELEHKK